MAIYYVWSGAVGSGTGASWVNAFTTLTLAFATEVAGDTLFVAHDHAESSATALTLTSSGTVANPTKVICVNRVGSVPPVSADRRTTGQVVTTGNVSISFGGCAHYDGLVFRAGNSTGLANIQLSGTSATLRFDNCSLQCGGSGATSRITCGGTSGGAQVYTELNNTTVSFGATGQTIQVAGFLRWRNTPGALLGTIPSNLIVVGTGGGGSAECIGIDLSAAGSGKNITGIGASTSVGLTATFVDCKLNAAVTKSVAPNKPGDYQVDFIRSGAAGVNYTIHRHRHTGLLIEETTIVRTDGASDGTTPIAWKVDTTANCTYSLPFECPPIAIWNDATGAPIIATVEGVWGGGAVPNNDEVWLDVEYLGDASSPMGSFAHDSKADLLTAATAQTSSSETWGGSTTKFKLGVTITPQQKGWVFARVKCAKPSSTFYIDPLVTLS